MMNKYFDSEDWFIVAPMALIVLGVLFLMYTVITQTSKENDMFYTVKVVDNSGKILEEYRHVNHFSSIHGTTSFMIGDKHYSCSGNVISQQE